MRFAFASVFLAAAAGAALAQDSSSSSSAAPSSSSSSSMAMQTSSSSTMAAGGASQSSSAGGAMATCAVLSGDPKVHQFGCPEGASTSTPPYDASSVESYLIAAYTPVGKQGYDVSSVASELVDSVTELYPTLTMSYSNLVSQYAEAISQEAFANAAVAATRVPGGLGTIAAMGAAVVAGGAFLL